MKQLSYFHLFFFIRQDVLFDDYFDDTTPCKMYQRSALEEKFDMRGANGEMFQLLAITCGNDYFNAKNKRVFFPSQLKDGSLSFRPTLVP